MDWRVAATTFVAVFLTEFGDKSQLATLGVSAQTESRWSVFIGSALALVAASGLGVLAGDVIARYVPLEWIQRAGGVLFVVIGGALLWGSFRGSA